MRVSKSSCICRVIDPKFRFIFILYWPAGSVYAEILVTCTGSGGGGGGDGSGISSSSGGGGGSSSSSSSSNSSSSSSSIVSVVTVSVMQVLKNIWKAILHIRNFLNMLAKA